MSEDCLDCGHSPHLHVNWVGSCSVYTKGKRCKCGIFRTHDTSPAYAIPFDQWPQPIGQSAGSESVGSQPDPITIKSYDFTHCARCGRSALAAVIDPKNGICTYCITDRANGGRVVGEPVWADPESLVMCDQCPGLHYKVFCPKKKTAVQEDEMGKKKDTSEKAEWWERLEFVTRITASMDATDADVRRLDSELDDLTARMDAKERDVVHLSASQYATDRDVRELLDRISAIERANSNTLWLERLGKRLAVLEDRLSPPSESSESQKPVDFDVAGCGCQPIFPTPTTPSFDNGRREYRETPETTTGGDPGIASGIHDTITEILSAHQANSWGCLCGWQYNVIDDCSHFDHVATRLLDELGLAEACRAGCMWRIPDRSLGGVMVEPVCQDCNQLVAEKQDLRDKLRSVMRNLAAEADDAYAVIAERQQRLEDDERNMRAARRQLELFMDDGIRERITVALALLDENVESRSEAWFDFTEQRGV